MKIFVVIMYFLLDNGATHMVELKREYRKEKDCRETAVFLNKNNSNRRTFYKCEKRKEVY